MADTNEYTDVVSAVLNQPAPQPNVHAGLALAADANPDFEAELHRLSAKTGVPLETARNATADVKRQAFLQDANPGLLQSQYPTVAGFLSDPTNASVAKDDIDNLSLFETIINGVKRGWQGLKQTGPTTALNANARILGDIERVQARIAAGEKPDAIPDIEDPYSVRYMTPEQIDELKKSSKQLIGGQAVDIAVGEFEKRKIPQPAIVGRVQEASKQGWKSAISTFMEDPVRFVASVGSESAVQNAPSLAATFGLGLAGAPGAAVAVTGAGSFATDYTSSLLEQLQKEGVDIANKDALIAAAQNPALMEKVGRSAYAHATVVSALDAVSGGTAGKIPLPSRIAGNKAAKYGAHAIIEPNVQGALGALGEAGGEMAQGEKLDPFNIIAEYVGEFAQTPGEHGGAAARKVYSEVQAARQAKQNVEIMQSLGDAASDSKLLNRLPEKLREFIAKAKEGGPIENVYIPAETFATYFQSAGVDPRDVAAELGIKDYSEALAAGADVAIPLEDYVAHLAGTEHHKALIGDMRLHPGDMTLREAEAFEKNRDEVIKRFMEHTQQQDEGAPAVYNQIKNDLLGQLLGRFDRKTAESYATLYAKGITTLAERSGVDPLALHEKYGLSVKSPLPDILTKAASTDINIDPLLDRLRAGDIPSLADVHGESLTEFVRRMGGLKDEGGDVKAMDADKGKRPFQRNMIQPITGLSYDYMREAAAEAGYFSHDVSEADFLSMLDYEIQGIQSTYADRNVDQQLLGLRETLEQIDRALNELGIDINNVTNEQVRAALDAAAQMVSDVAGEYAQSDDHADKRGYIQFGNDRKFSITLLEKADLSTFLHETGHFWLEVMGDLAESGRQKASGKFADTDEFWSAPRPTETTTLKDGTKLRIEYKDGEIYAYVGDTEVGNVGLGPFREGPSVADQSVDPSWQRKGVATAMYAYAEKHIAGFVAKPQQQVLTDDGKALSDALTQDRVNGVKFDSENSQIAEDYATLLKWFGVDNRSQITVEHHEQFARGFEAYLMEGKAPSPELRSIFQRFKAWLNLIYKQITALNVKLNNDVRGVFDRILASDAEIEAAKQDGSLSAIFATASDAGMTEAEFAAYKKTVEAASEAAKEDLEQKLMREYRRAQQQWYKDQRAKVQAEVADEIAQQPVYLAFDALVAGQLADGSMPGLKLNKDELVERYGAAYVNRLPTGGVPGRKGNFAVYTTEGGVSVEVAAEIFDFASPDEMIAALVDMKPRKELIKAETEARMRERYGDMRLDGSMHDAAVTAMHNDKAVDVMMTELRAMRKRSGNPGNVPPAETIRSIAAGMIGQKQVRDLQPNTYLLAERKASRQAFEAAAKGDYQAAAVAKQRELLNHYLYREAVKAQDDVGRVVSYAKRLSERPSQERIGKAGADYLKQINDLLEQYEFKPVSGSQLDRRRNLLAWYNAQVAAGFNPAITPELLENAGQRNYKEVPVDELRALKDALKSIESLATLKNQLLGKNSSVEYTTAVENLVEAAEKNVAGGNAPSTFKSQRGAFTVAGDWASKVGAELLQVEAVIDVLDGGRADGPWHQYIFNRASDAQTAFIETMAYIGAKVNALVEEHAKSGKMDDRFTTPLSGKPITRYELISIALNVGNQQNYDKMLRGMGWTAANVDAALSRLSAADWEFVQKTWDTINELWPQIAALEKRISGVEPEKIEARAYQIRDEAGNVTHEVKGGYYPLAYDPAHSNAGLKQESGPLAGLTEAGYAPATSPRGHTKARTEGFAAPLLLDFGQVLQKHLSGVVKDLTHREFLIDANRLFNDQRVRAVLQDTLGPEYEKQFMPWLKGIANDGNGENVGPLGKMFEHARASTTTVALGFKVATIVSQAAGIVNAMEYVGSGWIAKGLRQSMSSGPLYAFRGEALDKVLSKSGEMRHRFETLDRDVRDRLRDINSGKVSKGTKAIQRAAFAGIGYADRMVAIPTWLGAYEKALSQGMSEETAIHAADGAVRRSQGAGAAKDLSQIQRRGGAMKLFTMFMTPFGAAFGRLYNAKKGLDTNGMKYAPEAIMRVLMVTAIPAVIADLLAARGPDQCELGDVACYGKWAALKSVFSVTTTVPVLREMGNFAENYLSGSTNSRDIKLSPILDTFNKVEKSAQHTLESVFGDRPFEEKDFFDLMENSGYIANLPTAQARITIEYLYDLLSGNRNPQGPGELLHDLAFRRKENK